MSRLHDGRGIRGREEENYRKITLIGSFILKSAAGSAVCLFSNFKRKARAGVSPGERRWGPSHVRAAAAAVRPRRAAALTAAHQEEVSSTRFGSARLPGPLQEKSFQICYDVGLFTTVELWVLVQKQKKPVLSDLIDVKL